MVNLKPSYIKSLFKKPTEGAQWQNRNNRREIHPGPQNRNDRTEIHPGGSVVKNLPAEQETWVGSLGGEDLPGRRKWQPTPL